jgi:hypothetical protein
MSDKKDFFAKSLTKTKTALIPTVLAEPTIDPQTQINTVVKEIQDGGVQRLTLDIPLELHRRVKIRAAERGMSIKDFAVSIFEKELLG